MNPQQPSIQINYISFNYNNNDNRLWSRDGVKWVQKLKDCTASASDYWVCAADPDPTVNCAGWYCFPALCWKAASDNLLLNILTIACRCDNRSPTTMTCILSSYMGRRIFCWRHRALGRRLITGFCGQSASCMQLYYMATWLWPTSTYEDSAEPLVHRPRPMPCLFAQMVNHIRPQCCSHQQTMNHIISMCPSLKLDGGLTRLHGKKGKRRYSSSWEPHLRATGHHLPYGITQCYLPPDTSECAPPNPSHIGWYSIYLPQRDGRLSWPSWLDSAPAGSRTSDLSIRNPTPNCCTTKTTLLYKTTRYWRRYSQLAEQYGDSSIREMKQIKWVPNFRQRLSATQKFPNYKVYT